MRAEDEAEIHRLAHDVDELEGYLKDSTGSEVERERIRQMLGWKLRSLANKVNEVGLHGPVTLFAVDRAKAARARLANLEQANAS